MNRHLTNVGFRPQVVPFAPQNAQPSTGESERKHNKHAQVFPPTPRLAICWYPDGYERMRDLIASERGSVSGNYQENNTINDAGATEEIAQNQLEDRPLELPCSKDGVGPAVFEEDAWTQKAASSGIAFLAPLVRASRKKQFPKNYEFLKNLVSISKSDILPSSGYGKPFVGLAAAYCQLDTAIANRDYQSELKALDLISRREGLIDFSLTEYKDLMHCPRWLEDAFISFIICAMTGREFSEQTLNSYSLEDIQASLLKANSLCRKLHPDRANIRKSNQKNQIKVVTVRTYDLMKGFRDLLKKKASDARFYLEKINRDPGKLQAWAWIARKISYLKIILLITRQKAYRTLEFFRWLWR